MLQEFIRAVQAEDEGVVLAVVTGADGRTFLLVLDAHSMTELARCRDLHQFYALHCSLGTETPQK